MSLTYKNYCDVHVLTLRGELSSDGRQHLLLQLQRILRPEPGQKIHLTLDCTDFTEPEVEPNPIAQDTP